MTIVLGGPATTDAEDKLLADISGRVFRMRSYGQPALVKLLNNALGTYNSPPRHGCSICHSISEYAPETFSK